MEKIINERKFFEERQAIEIDNCFKSIKDSNTDEKRKYLQLWKDFKLNEKRD